MKRSDILIIGAGPTGLVLALWLTELGVKVPMSKRLGPRSTANCTSISTRPISWASSLWPGNVEPA